MVVIELVLAAATGMRMRERIEASRLKANRLASWLAGCFVQIQKKKKDPSWIESSGSVDLLDQARSRRGRIVFVALDFLKAFYLASVLLVPSSFAAIGARVAQLTVIVRCCFGL